MRDITELGRIGFGGYRIDVRSATHRAALNEALEAGCTLIDTASNYADGRSEALIGELLGERSQEQSPFVITKAGYVSPSLHQEFVAAGLVAADELAVPTLFRIDPDALRLSLNISRQRLRRPCLDAVLVHNPENLLDRGLSQADVYLALERAFCFLEDEVLHGRLRYYGISSNAGLDLSLVARAAARVSHANHLRFVEFPLNMLERQATQGQPSMIEQARGLGLRTVSHRPLNALVAGRPVRLAYYGETAPNASEAMFERCVELVTDQLKHIGSPAQWSEFAPMQFLRDSREDVTDPELVDIVWINRVMPFVSALFGQELTSEAAEAFDQLWGSIRNRAQAALAATTDAALAKEPGVSVPRDRLVEEACRFCLDAGVDHVLVGMRRPAYVRSLRSIFDFSTSDSTRIDRRVVPAV